jgi:hypothetical protein
VFGTVDQCLDDGPVLPVGLLATAAQFVEEGRLTRQCVPDLLDDPAEHRVLGGLRHGQVEQRVHRDPGGGVGLPLHPVQEVRQVVQVLRGAADRRVPGDRDLHMPTHFQQVARRVVAEGGVLDGVRDHEGALAGAGLGQSHHLEGAQCLTEHRAAHFELPAQLRLGGELVTDGVLAALDGAAKVGEHRFHGTDAPGCRATCLAV